MTTSFDSHGWLSLVEIPGRITEAALPGDPWDLYPVVGKPYPNFTGVEWVLATYSDPPVPDPKPAQRAAILAQLAEIDAKSDSPRARREALLGDVTWLTSLDSQAADLRAQLSALGQ